MVSWWDDHNATGLMIILTQFSVHSIHPLFSCRYCPCFSREVEGACLLTLTQFWSMDDHHANTSSCSRELSWVSQLSLSSYIEMHVGAFPNYLMPQYSFLKEADIQLVLIGCAPWKFIEVNTGSQSFWVYFSVSLLCLLLVLSSLNHCSFRFAQSFRSDTGYQGLLFVDPDRQLYKKIGCLDCVKSDSLKNSRGDGYFSYHSFWRKSVDLYVIPCYWSMQLQYLFMGIIPIFEQSANTSNQGCSWVSWSLRGGACDTNKCKVTSTSWVGHSYWAQVIILHSVNSHYNKFDGVHYVWSLFYCIWYIAGFKSSHLGTQCFNWLPTLLSSLASSRQSF